MKLTSNVCLLPDRFYDSERKERLSSNPSLNEIKWMGLHQVKLKTNFNFREDQDETRYSLSECSLYVPKKLGNFLNFNITQVNRKKEIEKHTLVLKLDHDKETHLFSKVSDVLNLDSKENELTNELQLFLKEHIELKEIDENCYIYLLPSMLHDKAGYWADELMVRKKAARGSGYYWDAEKEAIHIKELLLITGTKVITEDYFHKLSSMLDANENLDLVLKILEESNIPDSIIPIALLMNKAEEQIDRKTFTKKYHKLNAFITLSPRPVDTIVELSKETLCRNLTLSELELIADNYYNRNLEKSSLFKFELKKKK